MISRLRRTDPARAHFLHLGKTGGTAIKAALEPHVSEGAYQLELHGHVIRLKNIPRREPFFFAVRDPVDRYLSGFYSRQRQGAPRYHEPWSPPEKEAFERFETANDLAEAIYAEDRDTSQRRAASDDRDQARSRLLLVLVRLGTATCAGTPIACCSSSSRIAWNRTSRR